MIGWDQIRDPTQIKAPAPGLLLQRQVRQNKKLESNYGEVEITGAGNRPCNDRTAEQQSFMIYYNTAKQRSQEKFKKFQEGAANEPKYFARRNQPSAVRSRRQTAEFNFSVCSTASCVTEYRQAKDRPGITGRSFACLQSFSQTVQA